MYRLSMQVTHFWGRENYVHTGRDEKKKIIHCILMSWDEANKKVITIINW